MAVSHRKFTKFKTKSSLKARTLESRPGTCAGVEEAHKKWGCKVTMSDERIEPAPQLTAVAPEKFADFQLTRMKSTMIDLMYWPKL